MNDFTIQFDNNSNIPLYRQLYDYLLKEIRAGNLKENEKLPSRRALCGHLKINKNTVEAAYQKLAAEGYIMSKPRSGFYVRNRMGHINELDEESFPDYIYNFSIIGNDILKMPYATWVKLYKDTIYTNPSLFGHGENFGERILQKAIAKYVHEFRGVNCSHNQVIIGAGFDYLLLMLTIIMNRNTVYGIENPCMKRIYSVINMCDKKICLLDVTKNGFSIEALKNSNVNVLLIMPSHQYPVGYSMPVEQRHELLNWANARKNRYIVEFHHDSEFVYGKPLTSIQGLDRNEKVIYIGDFVKTIGPSIKTAYIILPKPLLKKWKLTINSYYTPVNLFEQWVLAEFMMEGYFMKHVKQMKTVYIKKRDFLLSELDKRAFRDKMEIYDNLDGTHFIAKFNTDVPENQMEYAARSKGVKIVPLTRHFNRKSGLYNDKYFVFGYGGLEMFEISKAVQLLEEAWGTL